MPLRSSRGGWTLLGAPSQARLRCISAPGRGVVWVAGADGVVLHSMDDGSTWHDVSPVHASSDQYRAVHAADHNCASLMAFGHEGRVLRTTDGGRHWAETYRPPDDRFFLNFLCLGTSGIGIVVSDPVDGRFRLAATSDGGASWTTMDDTLLPAALPGETSFAASGRAGAECRDGFAFVTGGAGRARVFRTAGDLREWEVCSTPFPAWKDAGLFSLAFDGRGYGVAVGGDYHHQERRVAPAVVTHDGGATWTASRSSLGYRSAVVWTGRVWLTVGAGAADLATNNTGPWETAHAPASFDTLVVAPDATVWGAGADGAVGRFTYPGKPAG